MHWIVYLGIALFSAIGSTVHAQSDTDARIELQLPYDTLGLGELVQISLVFHNTQPISDIQLPTVRGLEWLPGRSTAQSMRSINGVQTSSITYHYTARATELGLLILPSFETETHEGYFTTPELVAVVIPETPHRAQPERDDWFGQSPFATDPFFQQPLSPFGHRGDMDERMKQLRQEMQERHQKQLEEWKRRENTPSKKSKKQRKTYRI